jgi:hypothetical protein
MHRAQRPHFRKVIPAIFRLKNTPTPLDWPGKQAIMQSIERPITK